jgi:hypothetical protein
MRISKFPLGFLIVALILGVTASAFWAGHASSGSPSLQFKTYQPGWASIPWLDDTKPIDAALLSIADSVGGVYYLDPDSGRWQCHIPGRPEASNLTMMTFGQSYLMLFTKPVTLELVTQPEDTCPAGDSLTSYLLQEECTAAKLNIELGEITGVDMTPVEQFFAENCQGVQLLGGSPLGRICADVGMLQGASVVPGVPTELLIAAQKAAVLAGQYCVP